MKRPWHLALLIPFSLIANAYAQDGGVSASVLSQKVTLRVPASQLETALEKLSQATKVTLLASPQMSQEVLLLDLKELPLDSVMTRIATVTSGVWKPENGSFRLVPDSAARNRELSEYQQKRIEAIRLALQDRAKKLQNPTTAAAAPERPGGPPGEDEPYIDPGELVISQILSRIDPRVLAGMGRGDRFVFSSSPTAMQRPLPGGVSSAITQRIAAHNKTVGSRGVVDQADESMAALPAEYRAMMMADAKRRSTRIDQVGKVLFVVSDSSVMGMLLGGTGIMLSLKIYDSNGSPVILDNSSFEVPGFSSSFMSRLRAAASDAPPASSKKTPVELSEDSKAVRKYMQSLSQGEAPPLKADLPAGIRAKLLRPDQFDPLSFEVSDALFTAGKVKGASVVAAVPDSIMNASIFTLGETFDSIESLFAAMRGSGAMKLDESQPNLLLISMRNPIDDRAKRTNRRALANLLMASEKNGVVSLSDLAQYARVANPTSESLDMAYLVMMVPGIFSFGSFGFPDWDLLRFYGSLAPMQLRSLSEGGLLSVGQMNNEQRAILNRIVFGSGSKLRAKRKGVPESDFDFMGMFRGMFSSDVDFLDEPTEALPRGLPSEGALSLAVDADFYAKPVVADGESQAIFGALGSEDLAFLQMVQEASPDSSASLPKFDQVRIGERLNYNFAFALGPNLGVTGKLSDNKPANGAAVASMKSLPPAFADRVKKRVEALKKSPLGMMSSGFMGRGPVTPP